MIKDVRRVGSSGIVSLGRYFREAGIKEGDVVEIVAKYGEVVIRKVELKPVSDGQ